VRVGEHLVHLLDEHATISVGLICYKGSRTTLSLYDRTEVFCLSFCLIGHYLQYTMG